MHELLVEPVYQCHEEVVQVNVHTEHCHLTHRHVLCDEKAPVCKLGGVLCTVGCHMYVSILIICTFYFGHFAIPDSRLSVQILF